jgi:hypothetical protein
VPPVLGTWSSRPLEGLRLVGGGAGAADGVGEQPLAHKQATNVIPDAQDRNVFQKVILVSPVVFTSRIYLNRIITRQRILLSGSLPRYQSLVDHVRWSCHEQPLSMDACHRRLCRYRCKSGAGRGSIDR